MSSVSFARSSVVTWWHSATLSRLRPAAPGGRATAVGPRPAWIGEVETGTTMTERQPGVSLKASWETTMTGRRPLCSEPERGSRSAQ